MHTPTGIYDPLHYAAMSLFRKSLIRLRRPCVGIPVHLYLTTSYIRTLRCSHMSTAAQFHYFQWQWWNCHWQWWNWAAVDNLSLHLLQFILKLYLLSKHSMPLDIRTESFNSTSTIIPRPPYFSSAVIFRQLKFKIFRYLWRYESLVLISRAMHVETTAIMAVGSTFIGHDAF